MLPSLLLVFTLFALGGLAQGYTFLNNRPPAPTPCVTPQGHQGQCLLLKDCPELFKAFRQSRTEKTRRLLESLQCNSVDRYNRVCCTNGNQVVQPPSTPPEPTPPPFRPTGVKVTKPPPVSHQPMVDGTAGNEDLLQHRNIRLLPQEDCGLEFVSKIYGGNDTKLGEFPWAALLQYEKNGQLSFECGGALISDRYVLTAAHCTNKGLIRMSRLVNVRLGEYDVTKDPDCEPDLTCNQPCPDICADKAQDFSIEEEIVHPQYRNTSRNQYNDIALLRLNRPVTFSGFIQPICVPVTPSLARRNYVGVKLTATGWGRASHGSKSDVKLKANLPALELDECKTIYRRLRNVTNNHMCAGGVEGVDVCNGDSGGPLMSVEVTEGLSRYYVTGIVSYGSSMCHFGTPGVYTKTSSYADWIMDQLRP